MVIRVFKNEKTRKRNLFFCIISLVLLIGVFGYFGYRSISSLVPSDEQQIKEDKYLVPEYNYHLRKNATEYQSQLFNELKEDLKGDDDLKCAEDVVKNFVADFYTWTNKVGSYDVGGVCYMFSRYHNVTSAYARDNFYKYLTYYIKKYGSENLLEVVDVKITDSWIRDDKMTIDGSEYESYYIECQWEYNDYSFDSKTNYMKYGYFVVIKTENGRFEIAEAWGDD